MKRITNTLLCLFCLFSLQLQAEVSKEGFKKLNRIYSAATKSMKKVKKSADLKLVVQRLGELKAECLGDEEVGEIFEWTYEGCPSQWKEAYQQAIDGQLAMRDARDQLVLKGILKEKEVMASIRSFMQSVYLNEPLEEGQNGHEGAPYETEEHRDKRMKWWRDGKFGMFIHYGLFSGLAGEINGKSYGGGVEWIQQYSGVDTKTYLEKALPLFDPKPGKPEEWVKLAKEAGCKYVVLTSRHHEGFNMFDTEVSDFNVMKYKGVNVVDEYTKACAKYGMKVGLYFSLIDWNHPDYDPTGSNLPYPKGNIEAAERGERQFGHHEQYKDYLYRLLDDLLSQYKVDLLWWDYSSVQRQGDKGWGATRLMRRLFELQPALIQNNRAYRVENPMAKGGMRSTPHWQGDYSTPEQQVPATGVPGDWESCQTLNGTWGYSKFNHRWKTSQLLIRELIDAVSRGGNYLLNIGPMSDGSIPEESIRLFKEMGQWMKVNSEAIYETRANPFEEEFKWGRVTRKGDRTFYLMVYEKPADDKLVLPCTFGKVKAEMLDGGVKVQVEKMEHKTVIDLSDVKIEGPATVVKLTGKLRTLND